MVAVRILVIGSGAREHALLVALAADQRVVTTATGDDVVAEPAVERVVAATSLEGVVVGSADQRVGAPAAVEGVEALATHHAVVAVLGIDGAAAKLQQEVGRLQKLVMFSSAVSVVAVVVAGIALLR